MTMVGRVRRQSSEAAAVSVSSTLNVLPGSNPGCWGANSVITPIDATQSTVITSITTGCGSRTRSYTAENVAMAGDATGAGRRGNPAGRRQPVVLEDDTTRSGRRQASPGRA